MEDYGANIKQAMHRLGVNQERLAELIGKSQPWVSQRLSGARNCKLQDITLIANALGISERELLFPQEVKQPDATYSLRAVTVPIRAMHQVSETISKVMGSEKGILVNPDESNLWAVRVEGNSMTAAGHKSLPAGSIALIDPSPLAISNAKSSQYAQPQTVLAIHHGEPLIRQLIREGSKFYLEPLNQQYPTLELHEPHDRIIGVLRRIIIEWN